MQSFGKFQARRGGRGWRRQIANLNQVSAREKDSEREAETDTEKESEGERVRERERERARERERERAHHVKLGEEGEGRDERGGNTSKCFKDFDQKARTRRWSCLSYMCQVCSTAGRLIPLTPASSFRVQGLGYRVQGSGCRVQVSGFRV